jgi:hypothetical protein
MIGKRDVENSAVEQTSSLMTLGLKKGNSFITSHNFILPQRHQGHEDFFKFLLRVLRALGGSVNDLFGSTQRRDLRFAPNRLVRVRKTQTSKDEIGNQFGVPNTSRTSIRQLTVNFISQLAGACKCHDLPRLKDHVLTG